MTDKAIELARECGILGGKVINLEGGEAYWVDEVSEKTLTRFYNRAQAAALREAADSYGPTDSIPRMQLRRMAAEKAKT